MKIKYLFILTLMTCLFCSGCSFLSPVKTSSPKKYLLQTNFKSTLTQKNMGRILMVFPPTAVNSYDTTDMAYMSAPLQINYFAYNQWADTPGNMLQTAVVESLQQTFSQRIIVTPPYQGNYQIILNLHILSFTQVFTEQVPYFNLTIRAQLLNTNNKVLATKQFSYHQPMVAKTPYAGVLAAKLSLDHFLSDLIQFLNTN